MIIVIPLLVALIGLLMYALSANPKLEEIGRIMFFAGLLACMVRLEPSAINVLK